MLNIPPLDRNRARQLHRVISAQEAHLYAGLPAGQIQPLLNGFSRRYHADIACGWLSVKCMFNGRARYEIEGQRQLVVDHDHYLILNEGQPYRVTIDGAALTESFCVFLPARLAADALRTLTTPAERLLDELPDDGGLPIHFFERTHAHDWIISPLIGAMRAAYQRGEATPGWLEEQLAELMGRMLAVHRGALAEAERLPAARQATRDELYRRLHIARDYMHAHLEQPLTLEETAAVAALSPYHFLRSFRALFGETPHQYLTRLRIGRAKQLLRRDETPVTSICHEVGFSSLGSFSSLFKRRVGVSPNAYRAGLR